MNRRRLEGEVIRDSILAVGGRLNPEMGGPAIYPPLPDGMDDRTFYKHSRFWEPTDGPESRRRSVSAVTENAASPPAGYPSRGRRR